MVRTFERLESRCMLDGGPILGGIGDSNHDGRVDNLDVQSAICNRASAFASRPASSTPYAASTVPLFAAGGPVYTDPRQGGLNDCYLIASLSEVALKNPAIIQSMFTDNYDGTYTFRYYTDDQPYLQQGTPHYLVIDTYLPASYADYSTSTWAALAEKAFAVVRGGSYDSLNFGFTGDFQNKITGHTWMFPFNGYADISAAFANGSFICFESTLSPSNPQVSPQHAWSMIGDNDALQTVTLENPLGGTLTIAASDFNGNFSAIVGVNAQ